MTLRLVLRSLALRPGRSLLLLLGYSLGVGVMVALLSIGDALVEQSRDRELLRGGDLVVLPAGIDLETLRTGGVSSLYFTLDQAPYFYREVLTGPRMDDVVAAAAPWIDDELLYVAIGGDTVPVSAGGEIPSLATTLGAEATLTAGFWDDQSAVESWMSPTRVDLLREIDGFHEPPAAIAGDTTWAEWHYFSLLSPDQSEWVYVTFLVGGDLAGDRWGGQVLVTLTRDDGRVRRWEHSVSREEVDLRFGEVDLRLGQSQVTLRPDGVYDVGVNIPGFTAEFTVQPDSRRYLPSVDVSPGGFVSGYAVPVLRGESRARLCEAAACRRWSEARAYHDHNWGVWRDVTWDWGQVHAGDLSILYGGVGGGPDSGPTGPASAPGSSFLFVVDSLGLAGVLPVREIEYDWGADAPDRFRLRAARGDSWVQIEADVTHATPTERADATFFQMRGTARVEADLLGEREAHMGDGFFETWRREGL